MALFGLGKKKETACCCGAGATPESVERAEDTKRESGVKVLGGGCAECHELEANAKAALASLGLDQSVELITDFFGHRRLWRDVYPGAGGGRQGGQLWQGAQAR